ncbi:hypothetical protein [Bradyrhizobium sp. Y36]|uniref:hypothetical protein n=1 Tax=Bradyrhizobium sp. Y36 TaxID=2035447 RepID=UPI00130474AC|nr:hypothetical protein [Bradyrhizobium sp. Y36]
MDDPAMHRGGAQNAPLGALVHVLKAMLPEGFSVARKAPKVDLDREIQRLLDGAGR